MLLIVLLDMTLSLQDRIKMINYTVLGVLICSDLCCRIRILLALLNPDLYIISVSISFTDPDPDPAT